MVHGELVGERNLAAVPERIRLVALHLPGGSVSQRTRLTERQQGIVEGCDLPGPPRYYAPRAPQRLIWAYSTAHSALADVRTLQTYGGPKQP